MPGVIQALQCFLIRLQETGLVGLRCNASVVRQRLVAANHQTDGCASSTQRSRRETRPTSPGVRIDTGEFFNGASILL
jgi:hypothetical protein